MSERKMTLGEWLWLGSLGLVLVANIWLLVNKMFVPLYGMEFSHPAVYILGLVIILTTCRLFWSDRSRLMAALACFTPILITSVAFGYLWTSGVLDTSVLNSFVTKAEYVERYMTETTTTDEDGTSHTTTTYHGPYYNLYTDIGSSISVGSKNWDAVKELWCSDPSRINSRFNPSADDLAKIFSCDFDGQQYIPSAEVRPVLNFINGSQYSILKKKYLGDFSDLMVSYPSIVSNNYGPIKFPRVLSVRSAVDPAVVDEVQQGLDKALMILGKEKQVNILVVFAGTPDPQFRYALEGYWKGAKKNDLVVVIGTDAAGKHIDWVDAWALTDATYFMQLLKDDLQDLQVIDGNKIVQTIAKQVAADGESGYVRTPMSNYGFLGTSIVLPWWGFLVVGVTFGIWALPTILLLLVD